jgi:magnesium chelatase subunit I
MIEKPDSSTNPQIQILPYSKIVGQKQIKLALEIAYVTPPRVGGVLISGKRGTGKSTAARSFAKMMYGVLPVTLPINATEDRVVGGWDINQLMKGNDDWREGLLEEANKQLLYVDEVNLLDDRIINIILDVTSTGVLVVQRDAKNRAPQKVSFTMVGTMNPEEGGLRPQLLDRFGLMVNVDTESQKKERVDILKNIMDFDRETQSQDSEWLKLAHQEDAELREKLESVKNNFSQVNVPKEMMELCIDICSEFETQGNRGDYTLLMAARAQAALQKKEAIDKDCLKDVAPLVIQHRRKESGQDGWTSADDNRVVEVLDRE